MVTVNPRDSKWVFNSARSSSSMEPAGMSVRFIEGTGDPQVNMLCSACHVHERVWLVLRDGLHSGSIWEILLITAFVDN